MWNFGRVAIPANPAPQCRFAGANFSATKMEQTTPCLFLYKNAACSNQPCAWTESGGGAGTVPQRRAPWPLQRHLGPKTGETLWNFSHGVDGRSTPRVSFFLGGGSENLYDLKHDILQFEKQLKILPRPILSAGLWNPCNRRAPNPSALR